jgi:hypothetical protein
MSNRFLAGMSQKHCQAFNRARRNPGLFRLIRVTNFLVA